MPLMVAIEAVSLSIVATILEWLDDGLLHIHHLSTRLTLHATLSFSDDHLLAVAFIATAECH